MLKDQVCAVVFCLDTEPILFIIGAKDQFVPVETMVEMYRLVPSADLAVVPYVDHNFPRTHVSEFSELVRGYLNRDPTE